MRSPSTTALLLTAGLLSLACLNTSYSRKEEKQVTSDLTRIIAGQFAEHGPAFYHQQVDLHTATLAQDPTAVEARNDLAAAFIKLQRFEDAEKELLRIESEQPNRYKTHANLGVLYKKTGNQALARGDRELAATEYAKAADHTRRALEIKPEGHLGLGDYYLRMLEWRAGSAAADPAVDGVNFLGIRYDEGPDATIASPLVNREHLITLIKADRHFPETYLILGDVLFSEGDLQNAARAYLQTWNLYLGSGEGSGCVAAAGERLEEIVKRWEDIARTKEGYVFDHRYQDQILKEFHAAAQWLEKFKEVEADLIDNGVTEIDFARVQKEMASRELSSFEPTYLEAGLYQGSKKENNGLGASLFMGAFLLIGAAVAVGVLVALVRAARRRAGTTPTPA